jgi:hypothetical protein
MVRVSSEEMEPANPV